MRHPLESPARATMFRALAEEPQPEGALPFTEFIPQEVWATNPNAGFRLVHRIDFAVAVWMDDYPLVGVQTVCGRPLAEADFHTHAPEGRRYLHLCDDCLLHEENQLPTVYRCFDAAGSLLYVGCTKDFLNRLFQHWTPSTRKPWWHRVASITRETFPTMADALAAERHAIQTEHPEMNQTHKRRPLVAA